MGVHKACLPIDGTPLLMFSLQKLLKLPLERVVVTLPPKLIMDQSITAQLADQRVMMMANLYAHEGYAGSITTAILAMPHLDGMIVIPIDAPLLSSPLLSTFFAMIQHKMGSPRLMVPQFFHCPGHPVYISRHFFSEYVAQQHSPSLRTLIARYKSHQTGVMWPEKNILYNLNSKTSLAYFAEQNPALKIGDAAAIDAPGANCS